MITIDHFLSNVFDFYIYTNSMVKNNSHQYRILPEDFAKAEAPNRSVSVLYTRENVGDSPLSNLYFDLTRGVTIFGMTRERLSANEINDEAALGKWLEKKLSPSNLEILYAHYSQSLNSYLTSPILSVFDKIKEEDHTVDRYHIRGPEAHDVREKALILKEDGIYFNVSIKRHPIFDSDQEEVIGFIEGESTARFKLRDNGFHLIDIKTESKFMNDIFLNPPSITLQSLLNEADISQQKSLADKKTLKQYSNLLDSYASHLSGSKHPPKSSLGMAKIKIAN
jgi:hypothetical protein